jgi:uncharacterized protein with PIN domain
MSKEFWKTGIDMSIIAAAMTEESAIAARKRRFRTDGSPAYRAASPVTTRTFIETRSGEEIRKACSEFS